jgi:hypothetical protein
MKFSKLFLAAAVGFVLGGSACADDDRAFESWNFIEGRHTQQEYFYFAQSPSEKTEDISFTILYSSLVDCKPMVKIFIETGNDYSDSENGTYPIGNGDGGMTIRVDKLQTYNYEEGYYDYGEGSFNILVKAEDQLLKDLFAGDKMRIKVGTSISRFDLSGVKAANAMAYTYCEKNKSRAVKPESEESFFGEEVEQTKTLKNFTGDKEFF